MTWYFVNMAFCHHGILSTCYYIIAHKIIFEQESSPRSLIAKGCEVTISLMPKRIISIWFIIESPWCHVILSTCHFNNVVFFKEKRPAIFRVHVLLPTCFISSKCSLASIVYIELRKAVVYGNK